MWYERFFSVIDATWVGRVVGRRMELLEKTDPQHIYVENVRSFFNMPRRVAQFFCDLAVREGVFAKRVGYLCPKDRNIAEYVAEGEPLPPTIVCRICEMQGEEEYEFDPRRLQTIDVYSVVATQGA